jgi:hypothetical protein
MDNKAEEGNIETMDTSDPHEDKEESINRKLKCHNVCQVSLQIGMKIYSLIPVFDCQKMKTQLNGNSHNKQILISCVDVT